MKLNNNNNILTKDTHVKKTHKKEKSCATFGNKLQGKIL